LQGWVHPKNDTPNYTYIYMGLEDSLIHRHIFILPDDHK
jgi:hypothetical protein